jgi:uncharacterized protein (TIGR00369 family)
LVTESATPEFQTAVETFNSQPFSELLSAKLREFGAGVAIIEVPHRPELLQQHGFLHGGVIAYAIDNAITFAAGSVLGTNILTAGISVVFLRPAGSSITAIATVVGSTRRQAVVNCEVHSTNDHGKDVLVATGQGTAALIDRPRPRSGSRLEAARDADDRPARV